MRDADSQDTVDGIAIVGMACRFPGASTSEEFWWNLAHGVESVEFFSERELLDSGVDPALLHRPNYVRAQAVVEGADEFDAAFFGINRREAEIIDPQQRLFLECVYTALGDAGYDPEQHDGPIGLFAGVGTNDYLFQLMGDPRLVETVGTDLVAFGNHQDFLATRVAYKLNLKGQCLTVQTACSTSLVATHLACQSLLNFDCDMALAGASSINTPLKRGYLYQEGGIGSPDGHCRAFDAEARGTVPGSGAGVVVLKRLEDAIDDRDHIYAVIKGSALNNDGSLKAGFSAPNQDGQARVITDALAIAGVEPDTISYIEAHGTGTPLGDPIEVAALNQVFRGSTDKRHFCAIGSVKTNFGHLNTAAGIAGLIKTALALEHKQIPPSLHFKQPNPKIDFADSPFFVNTQLTEWHSDGQPRRAGVSSFGIGGTNAHLILEEAPTVEAASGGSDTHLLTISAKTPGALDAATMDLVAYLKQHPEADLADVAYTLHVGRHAFMQRRFVVAGDGESAVAALEARDPARTGTLVGSEPKERPVVFLFPGQGAQSVRMAAALYDSEPTFRAHLDHCADLLKPHLGLDLREILYPTEQEEASATTQLTQTAITQPALFAVEYALARLWQEWGIQPAAMMGHSIGEYVAACLADVFSLDDALMLVAARGRLMQSVQPGAMLAVPQSEGEVRPRLGDQLAIAAINGPALCVVTGPEDAVDALAREFDEQGVHTRRLQVSHAFHSSMMDPILDLFTAEVRNVRLRAPRLPYISNVTGTWITAEEATDPHYWATHLRQTVRFADGLTALFEDPSRILLEVGPGRTLTTLAQRHPAKPRDQLALTSIADLKAQQGERESLLRTLGQLWLTGQAVNWAGVHAHRPGHRIPLPTYPFERERFWAPARHPYSVSPSDMQLEAAMPASQAPISEQMKSRRYGELFSRLDTLVDELLGRGLSETDASSSWFELGFDSLLLIQLAQAIEDTWGVKIPLVQLLEEQITPDSLITYVDHLLPPEPVVNIPVQAMPMTPNGPEAQPMQTPAQPAVAVGQAAPPQLASASVTPPQVILQPYVAEAAVAYMPPGSAANAGTGDGHTPNNTIERLLGQQLDVMSQQLQMLRNAYVPMSVNGHVGAAPTNHVMPPTNGHATPASNNGHASAAADTLPTQPAQVVYTPNGTGSLVNGVPSAATGRDEGAACAPCAARTEAAMHKGQKEPYTPYKPLDVSGSNELTPRQKRYLDEFMARYNERTRGSKRLTQQYRPVLADSVVTADFRLAWKELIYPIVAKRSAGSRVWDVDGNEYIDITMGFGVHLFGHSPHFITEALEEQLRLGFHLGPQLELAGQAAELVRELTGNERVNFCNSGTEAVMGALRIARTVTRRSKIALFAGSYHGWYDGTLARRLTRDGKAQSAPLAPGVPPKAAEDVLILDYGSPEALDLIRKHAHELAAVLVEPVQSRRPDFQPREFLHALRALTEDAGIPLIFDEMVNGFRIHPGGAQEWFGVRADIVTYGKIVGGGLPIGVVAGKAKYMDAFDGGQWSYGDGSYPQATRTLFTGAFFKHPLTMAATYAVLKHMKEQGPALQERLNERTAYIATSLNDYFTTNHVPMEVVYYSSVFRFTTSRDAKYLDLLYYHLMEKGIFTWEGGNFFLSTAHTDDEIEYVIRAVKESIEALRSGGFFGDPPPDGPGGGVTPRTDKDTSLPAGLPLASLSNHQTSAKPVASAAGGQVSGVVQRTAPISSSRDAARPSTNANRAVELSLYYFGDYPAAYREDKYDLLLEGARFADRNGFSAIWVPERHFHSFGGFSPNPAVVAAALARETEHVHLRAGSVAVPLHHPIRVAEEWAVVDNLSKGRVGISFASGWHPNDFVFAPEAYEQRREVMLESLETVRRLWRGEELNVCGGAGANVKARLFPMPRQKELPIWLTCVSEESYIKAGELGAGVLTNLLGQTLEELAEKISLYRQALARAGHDPASGHVTTLVHSFMAGDVDAAMNQARAPFLNYLRSSFGLVQKMALSEGRQIDVNRMTEEDIRHLLSSYYERIAQTGTLVGTPSSCLPLVQQLVACGVDEIGCLIDFGVEKVAALTGLEYLSELQRQLATVRPEPAHAPEATPTVLMLEAGSSEAGTIRFPLTETQKGLWTLTQLGDEEASLYNEPAALRLRGPLNVAALHTALREVIARHESLRTTFSPDGDYQQVWPEMAVTLPEVDLSALDKSQRDIRLAEMIAGEAGQAFDLERGPLVRAQVITLGEQDNVLLLTMHHLITDGWSGDIILREIAELYSAACHNMAPDLPAPKRFRDYVAWLECQERSPDMAGSEEYWLSRFADGVPVVALPADRPRPPIQTRTGARCTIPLDPALWKKVKAFAARRGYTPFMTFLAGFNVLLHRLTGQEDVVVGVTTAGQAPMGSDSYFTGCCVNVLPLRSTIAGQPTTSEYLNTTRRTLMEAYTHQNYSIDRLIKKLRLKRDPSRPPLVSIMLNWEKGGELRMPGLEVEALPSFNGLARFDLDMTAIESEDGLTLRWQYNADLFDAHTIVQWAAYLETVLEQLIADVPQRVDTLLPNVSRPSASAQPLPAQSDVPVPGRAESDTSAELATPEEERLAAIWAEVLGLERVGIHDNFLELGGDSMLAIRVAAKAKQAGLRVTPKQLFKHQTVAELVQAASTTPTVLVQAEQEPVTGLVPMTPIQHYFFELDLPQPHHWNQAVMLEVQEKPDPDLLESALQYVVAHHDALRTRFSRRGSGWIQTQAAPEKAVPFSCVDLSSVPLAEQNAAIEAAAADSQAHLHLEDGPILRVVLFNLGPDRADRLLLVIHHLVTDVVSFQILLEDLETAYRQLCSGERVHLPLKTTSFKEWAERLTAYADSAEVQRERDYWLAGARGLVHPLPVDHPDGLNIEASARTLTVELNEADTLALLQDIPRTYRTQINAVLLTALARACEEWAGNSRLLVNLEGHGREEIAEGVDVSRTVGWFTTVAPLLLDVSGTATPEDALRAIQKQVDLLPRQGIGYGVLRYLSRDDALAAQLRALPQAEVSFNYTSRSGKGTLENTLFKEASESCGHPYGANGRRRYLLDVNGRVTGDRLVLYWTYSENVHDRATIERIARRYVEELRALVAQCRSDTVRTSLPSDFTELGVSAADLQQVLVEFGDLDV